METQHGTKTPHTCNGGSGPSFGRKTVGCPRCNELLAGAAPRRWAGTQAARFEASRVRAIRAHSCAQAGCSTVCCTFGDY